MKYYLPMLLLFLPNNFSLFFQISANIMIFTFYGIFHNVFLSLAVRASSTVSLGSAWMYKLCGPSLEKASLNVLP